MFLSADTMNSLPADVHSISETSHIASADLKFIAEIMFYNADDVNIITELLEMT